jgi:hypothetical protein
MNNRVSGRRSGDGECMMSSLYLSFKPSGTGIVSQNSFGRLSEAGIFAELIFDGMVKSPIYLITLDYAN